MVTSLRRVIWRWHFYAGIIVAPVLIVMAGTGAIYVFFDEIEELAHAGVVRRAGGQPRFVSTTAGDCRRRRSHGFQVRSMVASPEPTRATIFYVEREGKFQRVFVEPYRGTLLGRLVADGTAEKFFDVVLEFIGLCSLVPSAVW